MNFRDRKSYWLPLSFKFALLVSISLFSFFPELGLSKENQLCLVDNDINSESGSFDFEEELETFDLEMFCFDIGNLEIHYFDQSKVISRLNFKIPSGFKEIQLLPPEA